MSDKIDPMELNDFDPFMLAAVLVDGKRVFLDPTALDFNEQTVTKWLQSSHGWYSYFAQVQHEAEKWLTRVEQEHDDMFESLYLFQKGAGGCTEKQAEAKARQDPALRLKRNAVNEAKTALNKIKSHLKSFDKAFANATSLNYRQGKEIEKAMRSTGSMFDEMDDRINDIIKGSTGKDDPMSSLQAE